MESNEEALVRVAAGVRKLFHQLRALADQLHANAEGFTASHRAVMESLWHGGPQTVPALARARPVARQHIQVLVNDLAAMELVEMLPNPAHKRSALVALTAAGRKRFDAIRRKERAFLAHLALPLTPHELGAVADQLQTLSTGLAAVLDRHAG
jgi:DNA-binding MarR family transcriptional regulator